MCRRVGGYHFLSQPLFDVIIHTNISFPFFLHVQNVGLPTIQKYTITLILYIVIIIPRLYKLL